MRSVTSSDLRHYKEGGPTSDRRDRKVVFLEESVGVEKVKEREVVFVEDWKCQSGLFRETKLGAVPQQHQDALSHSGRKVLLGPGSVQQEFRKFPQGGGDIKRV